MRRTFLLQCAAVLGASTLAGCSAVKGAVNKAISFVTFTGQPLDWSQVVISAVPGANQNSPIAVDIVLVREESMLEKIAPLPAAKWFQTRADLLKTFPGVFSYKSWEVAHDQTLRVLGSIFGSQTVVGVFVFADYVTPGEHRIRVEQLQNRIIVELGARGFSVSPFKAD